MILQIKGRNLKTVKKQIKELKNIKKEVKKLAKERKKIIKKFFTNPQIPPEAKKQGFKILIDSGIDGLKDGLNFIKKSIESLEKDLKQINTKDIKNAKLIQNKINELRKLEDHFIDLIFKFSGEL